MSNWIDVCHVEDIAPLGSRVVKSGDLKIALFRTATGEVYAIEDKCPHKGGPLSEGIVHGNSVTCPLHNWVIDFGDGNAVAPDIGCTPTYAVEVRDTRVFLALSDPYSRTDASNTAPA